MNERLKELARQSADGMLSYDAEGNFRLSEQEVEKFAELIVEECRNVLADEYRKTPLECCGHFLRADEALAEHFYGVE